MSILGRPIRLNYMKGPDPALQNKANHMQYMCLIYSAEGRYAAEIGPYQLQAAISALHAQSPTWDATDWPQIAALYGVLAQIDPSPVVALNHAVAVSYAQTAAAGLRMMAPFADDLSGYAHFHAAKADLLIRDGQMVAAADCFQIAINLTENTAARTFLHAKARTLRPN